MTETPSRGALFISHATPEDNAFVRWLGAKLAAMGYEVWADVLRLHGGADWSRELEDALRKQTAKMLLVCTPAGLERQGVRNEIEIGAELVRELNDREFIIPLRLEPYKPPFRIAQAQYIDFSRSWAAGLSELVELLVDVYKVPRRQNSSVEDWLAAQSAGATRLVQRREQLISNWLLIHKKPKFIRYCEPLGGVSIEHFQDRSRHHWPVVPFNAGVLTFAEPDGKSILEPNMPARRVCYLSTDALLREGWTRLDISAYEARNRFADLGNQAFEKFLQAHGLTSYEGSNGRLSWWGNIRTVPLTQIRFDWPRQKGRRQIIGQSEKRGAHWHYGVSGQVRTAPLHHLRLSARLIFSENGLDALADAKRMHRLRRSFAKSWRNARWRDMMLSFLWWLANGRSEIELPVSNKEELLLALPPMAFRSPISALHLGEEPLDEDDPDVDFDDWDEYFDDVIEDEDASA